MLVAIDADGNVSMINKMGCELLGYQEDEIVGQNWFTNFLHKEHGRVLRKAFGRLMTGEEELPDRHPARTGGEHGHHDDDDEEDYEDEIVDLELSSSVS